MRTPPRPPSRRRISTHETQCSATSTHATPAIRAGHVTLILVGLCAAVFELVAAEALATVLCAGDVEALFLAVGGAGVGRDYSGGTEVGEVDAGQGAEAGGRDHVGETSCVGPTCGEGCVEGGGGGRRGGDWGDGRGGG